MTYRSQRVAYGWFAAALLLFALQVAFGFMSLAKYLGPDPLLDVVNFATTKAIHTNLLLVWLLSGFMGATFYLVPEESRTELHSERLAWIQLALWMAAGVITVVGYLFAAERLTQPLVALRGWLEKQNSIIMTVLLLVIGVVLIGNGIAAF